MNSRNRFAKNYKAAIRKENLVWKSLLEEALSYFKNCADLNDIKLHITMKKTPFIGSIITITSIIGIYDEYILQDNSPLPYLLTYKMSQDHLELFFCSVR